MTGEAHEKAVEAAHEGVKANARLRGWRGNDSEAWALNSDSDAAIAAYLASMAEQGDWDATNSVRLCDRCEDECGVSAGGDAGDRACSACGNESAPHVYPAGVALPVGGEQGDPLVRVSEVAEWLRTADDFYPGWYPREVARALLARFAPEASS